MANKSARRGAGRRKRSRRAVAARPAPLADTLHQVCRDLKECGARYALVGGLAVSARAEPRLTRDVDVAVAASSDTETETLIRAMMDRRYRLGVVLERRRSRELATVRLHAPDHRVLVDLLFAACGIEDAIVAKAQRLEVLPGLRIPVARVGHLIAMKLLARDDRKRPMDADDLRALVRVANATERKLVESAIAEIVERGFAGRRDLRAAWRQLLRDVMRGNRR